MIRRSFLTMGFVSLFILGAPANGYSDSLPALAGQASSGNDEQCLQRNVGVTNICNSRPVTVLFPVQSRATGTFNFYMTGPVVDNPPECWVFGADMSGNVQFQGYGRLRGMTSLGRHTVRSNTIITYQCNLFYNQSVYTLNWNP